MARLSRPVTTMIWSMPAATASSTPYWMIGLSTIGSISLGWALVAGRKRVPSPAAGNTAFRTFAGIPLPFRAFSALLATQELYFHMRLCYECVFWDNNNGICYSRTLYWHER